MRRLHNKARNDKLCVYFLKSIFAKYIVPTILLLIPVVIMWYLIAIQMIGSTKIYTPIRFIYLVCANVLTSIASVSIYHTVKTCWFGFNQINNNHYTVVALECKEKYRHMGKYYSVLSDNHTYRIYGKQEYDALRLNTPCELVVICNDFGAKIWEIVVSGTTE